MPRCERILYRAPLASAGARPAGGTATAIPWLCPQHLREAERLGNSGPCVLADDPVGSNACYRCERPCDDEHDCEGCGLFYCARCAEDDRHCDDCGTAIWH